MKNTIKQLICFLLVLALALGAFAGCKSKPVADASSEPVTSTETEPEDTSSEEEPEEEVVDEPADDEWDEGLEELPSESEEYVEALKVNNNKIINENFRGVNAIHQLYNYMPDEFGRMYNEKQVKMELDTLEAMEIKMIRSYYGSHMAWDPVTQQHDYESPYMTAFYKNCQDMEKIGIEVGITMLWGLSGFIAKEKATTQGIGLGENGFVVPGDLEATGRGFEKFVEESVLAFKAHGVNNVKNLFCFTECNNMLQDKTVGETTLEHRQYEKIYPIYDRAIKAVDKGLKNAGMRKQYRIVGPCDNWRADDGSEEYSRLVKYTVENLADEVDVIGSHNGYDRSDDYTKDVFYDIPPEKLTDPMERAATANKEFWIDEYNVAITQYTVAQLREAHNNPYKGVALGAMINSVMNMGGVNTLFLWTFYDQQWPNNTNGGGDSEFDNGVQVCGYLPTLLESRTPRAPWYALSLLTKYIGQGEILSCEVSFGVYISAIKRTDGEYTVVVTNYNFEDTPIQIEFAKSMGGKNFYRHLYWASAIEAVPGCETIKADAVAKGVTKGFCDTLPGGSVAVYTTVKD